MVYRETSIVSMATPSVSENLQWKVKSGSKRLGADIGMMFTDFLPIHARAPIVV